MNLERSTSERALRCQRIHSRLGRQSDSILGRCRRFHGDFSLKAFEIAKDRSDRTHSPVALEAKHTVFVHDVAFGHNLVPCLRMTNIVNWDIVMLAPEKRHSGEGQGVPQHIESCGLSLTLMFQ